MFISIFLKLLLGIVAMIIVVRVVGQKSLSKITPFDLIYTLVLGGILEGPLYDDKIHIGHILFAMVLWGSLVYVVEIVVKKNDFLNHMIKGAATILIQDGKLNIEAIDKSHIEMEQLRSLIRNNGYFALAQVKYLVLEAGGTSNVLPFNEDEKYFTYLLIDEGKIEDRALKIIQKDGNWLRNELLAQGYKELKDILYAEWSDEKSFFLIPYQKTISIEHRYDS